VVREEQSENAFALIVLTLSGIVTEVTLEPSNANPPIATVGATPRVDGMVVAPPPKNPVTVAIPLLTV
jgi:hypothetical protein